MISFLCVGSIKLSPRKNSTSMTGDRITLLARSRDSNQDKVMVWTCPILCRGKVVKPLVASSSPNSVPALNIGVRLSHLQWCPPGPPASLHTHDHPFPVQHYLGGDASSPSAGTRTSSCGSPGSGPACSAPPLHSILMLVSLQCGEVVQTWKEADLNTAMSQLLLQTHTLAGFKLVEFDEKIEMVEGIDGLRLSPYMCLVRGVLLTNTRR